jgi:calcium/calmodulin-dependent protein kinase (CaM kinase) II
MSDVTKELLDLTHRLLAAIAESDWATYAELCDPSLTAFEPEAVGQLVQGLNFHRYYFNLRGNGSPRQNTICSPHVRVVGDMAIVSYIRVTQRLDGNNSPVSSGAEETRVWEKKNGAWKHVHFHRSPIG